ncbi:MAG: DoxX family protein [Edaphobacter sp.]
MAGRVILGLIFFVAGALHFIIPDAYLRIMPPSLPAHLLLIDISGVAEMLGGIGLLMPSTRRFAAWGLVALLIAVWPANIYTAVAHLPLPGLAGQSWLQWLRIPLQLPLIYWAWMYTRG